MNSPSAGSVSRCLAMVPMLFCFPLLVCSPCANAQDYAGNSLVFLRVTHDERHPYSVNGFRVLRDITVQIHAVGSGTDKEMEAFPWILDASTRRVVWKMDYLKTVKYGSKDWGYDGTLKLSPGNYLVYFASEKKKSLPDLVGPLGDWLKGDKGEPSTWGITLAATNRKDRDDAIARFSEEEEVEPLVAIRALGDNAFVRTAFKVEDEATLEIYALGEGPEYFKRMFDYSWIVDRNAEERVWEMTLENTSHGGGAEKNRVFRGELTLPKGSYLLYTITDDSHSAYDWNATPPFDPDGWGITVRVKRGSATLEEIEPEPVLMRLTGVGDGRYFRGGFSLDTPADLHVYAFGEGLFSTGEMTDYGWIVNDETKERVWKMNLKQTMHGGGSPKNRLFDGLLHLEPGKYSLYYRTDGGHSFEGWEESPPFDPASYGITLFLKDKDVRWAQTTFEDTSPAKLAVVRIAPVGDNQHLKKSFHLKDQGAIRIYALGEGIGDAMADYAWIEAEDGRLVWKMTMDKTTPAGGSSKNRLFEGTLELTPGEYTVHYRTDDSHAYGTWNSRKPDDPESWGVTIYRVP